MANKTYAVEAVLAEAEMLKNLVDGFKDLVKDVNFVIDDTGITMQSTDSSAVALIHVMIRESSFEKYKCRVPVVVGMNAESLGKILKLCQPTDKVTLKVTEDKETNLTFESPDGDRVAGFDLKVLEVEQEDMGVPDRVYDIVVKLPSKDFHKAIVEMKDVGDVVILKATKDGMKLTATGDMGTGSIFVKSTDNADEEQKLQVTWMKDVELGFGFRYVHLFTRASGLSKTCTINLKDGEPMMLQFDLGKESNGFLKFVLAPQLGDE